MKTINQLNRLLMVIALCGATVQASAQEINLWRGNETKADWSDPYKWKLKHVPAGEEAVHFRNPNSLVNVSSTIELDNGMMLYGQDLFLQGNGNINMWSPIEHKSTVNIPASSSGHANLTLSDNLSLNGQIALAAKSFGTSASKGSVTLKDRSTITGKLKVGNNGSGSGQVYVRDQATYRIQEIEFDTLAEKGGAAELHILGGTVHLETKSNPFDAFLADPSRKIIIGDYGSLKINSAWAVQLKKNVISKMISQKRIVAAQGCELMTPIFHRDMILIKAQNTVEPRSIDALLADIKESKESVPSTPASQNAGILTQLAGDISKSDAETKANPSRLESLLNAESASRQLAEQSDSSKTGDSENSSTPLAGYIVFFSAIFFFLRPAKAVPTQKTTKS